MREMAAILQAQELPPKMLLSPEVNISTDIPGQA